MTREARYVSTRPRARSPLTAPNSAPLRICPRGAEWGQRAGTAKRRTKAAATVSTVPRRRAGVAAQARPTERGTAPPIGAR